MFKRLWARTTLIVLLALFLGFLDLPTAYKTKVFGDSNTGFAGWVKNVDFHLGLDLQGGTQLRYRVDTSNIPALDRRSVVDGITGVIERRINSLGISEALVQSSQLGDDYYIIVELPGVKDINDAVKRVGKTVQLEFKEQRTDWTAEEKVQNDKLNAEQTKKAQDVLKEAQKPGSDFAKLVRENSEGRNIAQDGIIDFETEEDIDPALWPQLSQLNKDQIALVETDHGIYIEKVLESKKEPKELQNGEKVTANHILIAYKGSTGAASTITRTKEDAQKLADEVKGKVTKTNFGDLAKQYSDDASNKDKAGSLGTFERGAMVQKFEDAEIGRAHV